ncbi:MAG: TIGR04053 family radical SAM/SPASM domain-containing protein [Elusimicrobia bacterium]|nr:TIGR04053 family radical SAM/SPASM domain-containing protein [Elusimicrobiota bacterium]
MLAPKDAVLPPKPFDFSSAPLLVIWETTRSCALSCAHCRADADLSRDPRELSTDEGFKLIDQVADMGTPILILSGGDPLVREDLEDLVRHAKSRKLRVGTIPAATPNLTRERLASLKDAGLDQVAFSLDGDTARSHDEFRRAPGAFARVLQAVEWSRELGLPMQINTCLGAWNIGSFESIVDLVSSLPIAFWEVFFLIPVGRGAALGGLTPEQFETVFARLRRLSLEKEFVVKLTEAPHFRRYLKVLEAAAGSGAAERVERAVARPASVRSGLRLPDRAVNAGDGFMFVDHLGGVCPSGFLPEVRGNVRDGSLARLYREDALFTGLRDHERLGGKCGVCEYRQSCGGSRARAWATTGDAWAEDASCAYVPASPR